ERLRTQFEDAGLKRQMAAEVTQPTQPLATNVLPQRSREDSRVLFDGQRVARIRARDRAHHHREIADTSAHRTRIPELAQEQLLALGRDPSKRGTEAEYVVEGARIAQRPH